MMAPFAVSLDDFVTVLRKTSVEDVLWPLLIQLTLIILVARLFAVLFRKLGQPSVVGEILAGLVLGPSLLGHFFPELFQAIFHPSIHGVAPVLGDAVLSSVLTSISEIGLLFLLFLIGLEFDFSHLRWQGRTALSVAVAGILLPFGLGIGLGLGIHSAVAADVDLRGFVLFLGTAISITAIPVLGRIMLELGITRTRLGTITLAAAALDDALGWILLAAVASAARSAFNPGLTLLMAGETLAFALVMFFLARPLLCAAARMAIRRGQGDLTVNALAGFLVVVFASALVTNRIGIFSVFGPFVVGAVLSSERAFAEAITRRLRDFVTAFFLPIFFAYTGLRTNIGSLDSWQLWLIGALVLVVAVASKLGGCVLACRLNRLSWRDAACIGVLMNTRGLMALIVINLGKDLGVVPESLFCMLVLMALVTTALTTPLLLRWMKGTELEPLVHHSGFVTKPLPQVAVGPPT